jgi:hypothetical protein
MKIKNFTSFVDESLQSKRRLKRQSSRLSKTTPYWYPKEDTNGRFVLEFLRDNPNSTEVEIISAIQKYVDDHYHFGDSHKKEFFANSNLLKFMVSCFLLIKKKNRYTLNKTYLENKEELEKRVPWDKVSMWLASGLSIDDFLESIRGESVSTDIGIV